LADVYRALARGPLPGQSLLTVEPYASFNPSKHHLSIMFHRGAEIPGDHPRLEGDGRLVRTMRFADLDQLEAGRADLEAAVRAWCDWKAASPSRR
jgi:hypothetical protein